MYSRSLTFHITHPGPRSTNQCKILRIIRLMMRCIVVRDHTSCTDSLLIYRINLMPLANIMITEVSRIKSRGFLKKRKNIFLSFLTTCRHPLRYSTRSGRPPNDDASLLCATVATEKLFLENAWSGDGGHPRKPQSLQ